MLPDITFGMVLRRLLDAAASRYFGQYPFQNTELIQVKQSVAPTGVKPGGRPDLNSAPPRTASDARSAFESLV